MKKRFYPLLAILVIASLALIACSSPSVTTPTVPSSKPPATTTTPPVSTPAAPPSSTAPSTSQTPVQSTSPAASAGTPQRGGILRMIASSSPLFIGDPSLGVDATSMGCEIPDLEPLLNSDNSGKINPVLATSWTVAPDGKSITFNLRKGVKFHDGTDFNAAAAKWNMERFMTNVPGMVPLWIGVDVIDDYTIKLNLKAFMNTIYNDLEAPPGLMVSPTAAQKNGLDWMKTNEAGTGPFMVKSFSRDVSLVYTRFDNYWGDKPYLDGITITFIPDANTARTYFEAGQQDVFSSNSDAVAADLIKKGYLLDNRPSTLMVLVPDSKHENSPFSKLAVRQALSYAIDRDSIVKTLGYGFWEVANQPAASYQFGRIDPSQVPYKYDPAKAQQLLAAAGYPNGFSTTIIYTLTFGNSDPLLAIQSSFKDIGINVTLNQVEFAAWNNFVNKGWDNAMVWATQGVTQTNYSSFLSLYYSAATYRYPVMAKSTALTDVINQALATQDFATEKTLCQQAVKMLVDDCTTIPTYGMKANYLLQKNVHDTRFSNLGGAGFRWSPQTAWLSK